MAYKNTSRYLGAAFLFVVFIPLACGLLFKSVVGAGDISTILVNIANQPLLVRISVLGQMVTSAGIVVLAGLLYAVLNRQNKIVARFALGLWLAEALFLAINQAGVLALIPLSLDFIKAGSPANSFYQVMGQYLYEGVYGIGSTLHMWFYCVGGLLWYSLFYRSAYIPRVIPLYGLIAVSAGLVGIALEFLGVVVPIYVYLPILPFELIIGFWLMLKGTVEREPASQAFIGVSPA